MKGIWNGTLFIYCTVFPRNVRLSFIKHLHECAVSFTVQSEQLLQDRPASELLLYGWQGRKFHVTINVVCLNILLWILFM
jgi:hypothetical protein